MSAAIYSGTVSTQPFRVKFTSMKSLVAWLLNLHKLYVSFEASIMKGLSTTQMSARKAGIRYLFIARLLIMKQETPRYPALVRSFAGMTSTLRDTMKPWKAM